jgi:hypothetical protein
MIDNAVIPISQSSTIFHPQRDSELFDRHPGWVAYKHGVFILSNFAG